MSKMIQGAAAKGSPGVVTKQTSGAVPRKSSPGASAATFSKGSPTKPTTAATSSRPTTAAQRKSDVPPNLKPFGSTTSGLQRN